MPAASPVPAATPPDKRRALRDFSLLVLGATVIGLSSVLVRLSAMDPAAVSFWRMAFALPAFAVWAWFEQRDNSVSVGRLAALAPAAAVAGFAFAIDITTSNMALALTTMTNFIILVHLAPVIVVVVAWFWFKERPTAAMLFALPIAIVGAVLLVQASGSSDGGQRSTLGDLLSIAAAFGYAVFILFTRQARRFAGAGTVSFVSTLVCGLASLAFAIALGERILPHTLQAWLLMAGLGLGCHALGQGLSAYAVGTLGASLTSIVLVYGVAVTVFSGWVVFGETPGLIQLLGGGLVLAAVMLCRPR